MSHSITHVLFDLDGTLLDTADDLGAALNFVLKQQGLPEVSPERYRPVASNGSKGLIELGFGDRLDEFNFDQLRQDFLDYYEGNISKNTRYMPDAEEALHFLNDNGIDWGVVTNKPHYLTVEAVKFFPLFDHCKSLISGDTLPVRKPDPAPIELAMEQIGTSAQHCLYIGDAERDIQAGRNAGCKTAVVLNGFIPPGENTDDWQPDMAFTSLQDLIRLFKH